MNRPMTPEMARQLVDQKLDDLRREAAVESLAHTLPHTAGPSSRPRIQRALGHALIGLGRTLAGEPAL